jgi:hypothetical protein
MQPPALKPTLKSNQIDPKHATRAKTASRAKVSRMRKPIAAQDEGTVAPQDEETIAPLNLIPRSRL